MAANKSNPEPVSIIRLVNSSFREVFGMRVPNVIENWIQAQRHDPQQPNVAVDLAIPTHFPMIMAKRVTRSEDDNDFLASCYPTSRQSGPRAVSKGKGASLAKHHLQLCSNENSP